MYPAGCNPNDTQVKSTCDMGACDISKIRSVCKLQRISKLSTFFPYCWLPFWHNQWNASQFVRRRPEIRLLHCPFFHNMLFFINFWAAHRILLPLQLYGLTLAVLNIFFVISFHVTASCCVLTLILLEDLQLFFLSLLHFSCWFTNIIISLYLVLCLCQHLNVPYFILPVLKSVKFDTQ